MISFLSQHAVLPAVLLATLLPLIAFAIIIIFTRTRPALSARLSIGAVTISLVCSILLLGILWKIEKPIQYTWHWFSSSNIVIPYGFLLDPLSVLMLCIVATISFLVQVYSLGYMAGDPGFSRYYAFMSLFGWAMMSLTLSSTIIQLYVFWELVGLSSYLLIGFWYQKFSASQAGKKAFVMTRAGDVAFYLGFLIVLLHLGSFSILEMDSPAAAERMTPTVLTLSALLIFGGIVGKSAQFPLMTWLPDAMEGPTPVSALLHSATMVAAGVYLFARLYPFFSQSPVAMEVFLAIGTISMLLASTMAIVSRDIKKVWAYSTISQLGFMIMALAAGGYFAGIFHLTTHAAFKALLFLCSGVFIHYYETNDIFELGSHNWRRIKIPSITIIIGGAALSGLPPLSGFFSKEAIMAQLAGGSNLFWLGAGLAGVLLTSYYTFRVIFVLFSPRTRAAALETTPDSGQGPEHHHGNYWVMAWPLIVLAAITLVLGFAEKPIGSFLTGRPPAEEVHGGGPFGLIPMLALGLALFGVLLAWVEFGRKGASQIGVVERIPVLYNLFAERWYIDAFYRFFLHRGVDKGISYLCYENDNKVIDGSIDGLSEATIESGRVMAFLNSSMIQYRLVVTFAVMALLTLYFFF